MLVMMLVMLAMRPDASDEAVMLVMMLAMLAMRL